MERNGGEVVVPFSKAKIATMVLICYGGIVVLFWLGSLPEHHNFVDIVIMVIGVIFLGYFGNNGVSRLYSRNPGLAINDRGIMDNVSGNGLIDWDRITQISIVQLSFLQDTLSIEVKNLDDFYSDDSRWKRLSRKLSFIPAIQIPLIGLEYDSKELNRILQEWLEKARQTKSSKESLFASEKKDDIEE